MHDFPNRLMKAVEIVAWGIVLAVFMGIVILVGTQLAPAFGGVFDGPLFEERQDPGFMPLDPIQEDSVGPNRHTDGSGRVFRYEPQEGLNWPKQQEDPLLDVKPNVFGPNIGQDQYGRPVRPKRMSHNNGYYNLEDITKDHYQADNEGLQPPYFESKELPYISPLECGIERMVPLNTFMESKQRADGTTWFYFDTNKDGIFDVTMSLPTQELEVAKANGDPVYPHLYFFDRDYVQSDNGPTPEIGYADTLRNGQCVLGSEGNIRIYWTPKMQENKIGESDCIRGDCDKRQEGDL